MFVAPVADIFQVDTLKTIIHVSIKLRRDKAEMLGKGEEGGSMQWPSVSARVVRKGTNPSVLRT